MYYDIREVGWVVAIARIALAGIVMIAGIIALDVVIYLGAASSSFDERVAAAFGEGYDYGYAETFEVAYQGARDEAYERGYDKGYEISLGSDSREQVSRLVETHNPAYSELVEFLAADKTDSKPFIDGEYVCFDFTAELNNNADANGIRAAYVRIRGDEWSHAVVAFETVDRGLVFIEPQSDMEVKLVTGKPYPWRQVGATSPLGYLEAIVEIQLIW